MEKTKEIKEEKNDEIKEEKKESLLGYYIGYIIISIGVLLFGGDFLKALFHSRLQVIICQIIGLICLIVLPLVNRKDFKGNWYKFIVVACFISIISMIPSRIILSNFVHPIILDKYISSIDEIEITTFQGFNNSEGIKKINSSNLKGRMRILIGYELTKIPSDGEAKIKYKNGKEKTVRLVNDYWGVWFEDGIIEYAIRDE